MHAQIILKKDTLICLLTMDIDTYQAEYDYKNKKWIYYSKNEGVINKITITQVPVELLILSSLAMQAKTLGLTTINIKLEKYQEDDSEFFDKYCDLEYKDVTFETHFLGETDEVVTP